MLMCLVHARPPRVMRGSREFRLPTIPRSHVPDPCL
jgi:hypothetical protein